MEAKVNEEETCGDHIAAFEKPIPKVQEKAKYSNEPSPKKLKCYEKDASTSSPNSSPPKPRNIMDIINPSLYHLAEKIFLHLDHKNLLSCRRVNRTWKEFFDNPRFWLKKHKKDLSKKLYDVLSNTTQILEDVDYPHIMALSLIIEGPKASKHSLNIAAKFGNSEMVQTLLESGQTSIKPDPDYNSPIHGAAKYGHVDNLKILVPYVDNPFLGNCHGQSPIHLAAKYGHVDVVRYLSSLTKKPNIEDYNQETPLQLAKKNKNIEIMKILVPFTLNQDEKLIKWHVSSEGEIKYKCRICDKGFKCINFIKKHAIRIHGDEDKFPPFEIQNFEEHQCYLCGICFNHAINGLNDLNNHMENVHVEKNEFRCDICLNSKVFNSECVTVNSIHGGFESALSDLQKSKNLKSLFNDQLKETCDHQDKEMKIEMKLDNQTVKISTACRTCANYKSDFKSHDSLKEHFKTKHQLEELHQDMVAENSRGAESPSYSKGFYTCKFCGMIFSELKNLQRHVEREKERQNNSKLCRCYICGESFNRSEELKRHINDFHEEQHYSISEGLNRANPITEYLCPCADYDCYKFFPSRHILHLHIGNQHLDTNRCTFGLWDDTDR